jgi:hypothetical protein
MSRKRRRPTPLAGRWHILSFTMNVIERLEWIWVGLGAVVSVAFAALCAAYFAGWLSP